MGTKDHPSKLRDPGRHDARDFSAYPADYTVRTARAHVPRAADSEGMSIPASRDNGNGMPALFPRAPQSDRSGERCGERSVIEGLATGSTTAGTLGSPPLKFSRRPMIYASTAVKRHICLREALAGQIRVSDRDPGDI